MGAGQGGGGTATWNFTPRNNMKGALILVRTLDAELTSLPDKPQKITLMGD